MLKKVRIEKQASIEIKNGIEGVPMPASTMKPAGEPNAKGLTPADIWDIVNYVQSLPFEAISNPLDAVPTVPEAPSQMIQEPSVVEVSLALAHGSSGSPHEV